ncbi:ATP-dependent rRNA helicase SPB4, partial [Dictyocoela roeselum]
MDSIADISKMVLRNPVRIRSDQGLLLDLLYVECTPMRKLEFLFLLNGRCVVFFATCAEVDFFYSLLMVNREGDACTYGKIDELKKDKNKNELKKYEKNDQNEDKPTNELKKDEQNPSAKAKTPRLILKLHSKMLQTERTEIYRKIESKETFILLCTDIAARGLDFEIDRVVHFDIPHEPQTLTHRSGRAARNGRRGEAILLLMKNEMPFLNYLAQKDLTASAFDFSFKDPDYSDLRHESLLAVKAFVAYIRSYKE